MKLTKAQIRELYELPQLARGQKLDDRDLLVHGAPMAQGWRKGKPSVKPSAKKTVRPATKKPLQSPIAKWLSERSAEDAHKLFTAGGLNSKEKSYLLDRFVK